LLERDSNTAIDSKEVAAIPNADSFFLNPVT